MVRGGRGKRREGMKKTTSGMKLARGGGAVGRIQPPKIGVVAVVACLLLPCFFVAILKPNLDTFSIWNLRLSIRTTVQLARIKAVREDASGSAPSGTEMRIMPLALKEERGENQSSNLFNISAYKMLEGGNKSVADTEMISSPISYKEMQSEKKNITSIGTTEVESTPQLEEKQRENKSVADTKIIRLPISNKEMELEKNNISITGTEMIESPPHFEEEKRENNSNSGTEMIESPPHFEEEQRENNSNSGNLASESKLWCDLSQQRSDTCFMHGDVRVLGPSSSLILASPSQSDASIKSPTWKIRPYARKWEPPVMETIKELTLRSSAKPEEIPHCMVNHSIPAVVFSTGGFLGNFFHDFTDVLIPLFITSRQYQGEVQFIVTNFNSKWISKYSSILNQLSRYEIINLDRDGRVHCFRQAQVGLLSHKVLGVDPSITPNGYSMNDFREMLRTSFSLKRKHVRTGNKRPRLLILQRKGSRSFMNKREVAGLGRSSGFKVIVAGPEETKDMSRFARVVNSCDVMMGVHGAGLTNMMFLPTGAALIQIVPLGGLKWACWHDFGEPAPDMGVRYLEYEIKEEESSLIQQYPRDDPVFTDPLSIQKQGWNALWSVYLHKQSVKLDVRRFKPLLLEALQTLH